MSAPYADELTYLRGLLSRALPHVDGGVRPCDLPPDRAALRQEIAAAIGSRIVDTDEDIEGAPV